MKWLKINKSDKPSSGFLRRFRFHLYRGRGHLLRYLWNRIRWNIYPQFRIAGRYPDHVDVELSAFCNMKCPMCYTVTQVFKKEVPHTNMNFNLFKQIVDELAANGVYSIRLSWRGEPTINKHFVDCIRYAKQQGIKEVDSLSNALKLNEEMFADIVDLQMDWLTISFDGTGETYERIRHPAKFDEMVAKIRRFSEIKKEKNSVKPVIRIQGIWPAIEEDPDRYFETFEPIVDEVSVNDLLDYLHNDTDIDYLENFTCPVPFQRMVIGADGRVFMCINDELGKECVGDTRTETIEAIWNGPKMQRIREIQKSRRGCEELEPCKACYQPRKTELVPIQLGTRQIYLEKLVGRSQEIGK